MGLKMRRIGYSYFQIVIECSKYNVRKFDVLLHNGYMVASQTVG
jgi:hypothetical protein